MKKFGVLSVEFILTIVGIVLLGKLPFLFFDMKGFTGVQKLLDNGTLNDASYLGYGFEWNWSRYMSEVMRTGYELSHLTSLDYYYLGKFYPVFPTMWEYFLYSMQIFSAAIVLSICIAGLVTYLIMLSPNQTVRKIGQGTASLFQAIPDVLLIIGLQVAFIFLFKKTGVLIFNVHSSFGDEAYALPIICLSILPSVFLIKTMSLKYEDELEKRYVETALAKGVKRSSILVLHVLRNTLVSFFHNYKVLFWFMLSNLLMLEILFSMDGFIQFLWRAGTINPHIFTIGILMIFIPFFIIFVLSGLLISRIANDQEGVFG
ncbi:ABC transporter permease subunit [Pseudalkalibacillus sp. Hm43]|uniref:ABC transporter permease subunit n=1 Tax=Pseudalkalibacillus sp. Hm43 TaxID=3450742 RepID=UPI003F424316